MEHGESVGLPLVSEEVEGDVEEVEGVKEAGR
jgi:hypothetical protein